MATFVLQNHLPEGGRSRAAPDAPPSGGCVEVNCAPSPAPHSPPQSPRVPAPASSSQGSPRFALSLAAPRASLCALAQRTPSVPSYTYTPSSVTFLSPLLKAAQYQAQKVIIKASLAAPDSAVRVVWRPKARVTPASPEHLCKRGTGAPTSTSLGISGKSLTRLEPRFHL